MLGVEQPLATEPVEAHATVPVVERAEWNDPRVIAPLVAGADVMHLCRSTADDAAHRRDPRHVAGLLGRGAFHPAVVARRAHSMLPRLRTGSGGAKGKPAPRSP